MFYKERSGLVFDQRAAEYLSHGLGRAGPAAFSPWPPLPHCNGRQDWAFPWHGSITHRCHTHTQTHWVSTAHLPAREKLSNPSWSARGRVTAPDKRTLSEPWVDGGLLIPMCLCLIPSVLSHNWITAVPPLIPNSSHRFNMRQEFDRI